MLNAWGLADATQCTSHAHIIWQLEVATHEIFVTTATIAFQFQVEDIGAVKNLNKSVICRVFHNLGYINAHFLVDNERVQLCGELLEEIDVGILSPEPLEGLESEHQLPLSIEHATLGLDEGPSVVLVTAVEYRTRLVIYASHLEGLMDLFPHIFIIERLWPIVAHLDSLICVGVSHLEVALLNITLAQLLELKLTCLLHSLVMQLTLGYLSRLADEVFKRHVQVIKSVKMHLCLIKLILEVQ